MDKEKLAKQIMADYEKDGEPISYEEALEVAEMEIKEKALNNLNGIIREKKSVKKPKEKKISDEKSQIFNDILTFLSEKYDVEVLNEGKKIGISLENKHFTVDLIENRAKKE